MCWILNSCNLSKPDNLLVPSVSVSSACGLHSPCWLWHKWPDEHHQRLPGQDWTGEELQWLASLAAQPTPAAVQPLPWFCHTPATARWEVRNYENWRRDMLLQLSVLSSQLWKHMSLTCLNLTSSALFDLLCMLYCMWAFVHVYVCVCVYLYMWVRVCAYGLYMHVHAHACPYP